MINLHAIRADIPALSNLIHFNNAGTSLMPAPVYATYLEYLEQEQNRGAYEVANQRAGDTDNFYQQTAKMIHCTADEIAFCESATRAWQSFFYSLKFQPGDQVVTTQLDYGSNFVGYIHQQQRLGIEIVVIPCDDKGEIDFGAMRNAINYRTKLLSVSHIPTANGIISDVAKVGEIASDTGIPFLLDACQSVGQINVDVNQIGCTALSATGRKYLRGPRGTGFLYVDKDFAESMDPPWLDQHGVNLLDRNSFELCSGARRFENFETNFAARITLGKAIEYANNIGLSAIGDRIISLGSYCRDQLVTIPQVTLQDTGSVKGGIVMFSHGEKSPAEIVDYLHQHNVNVWASSGPGSLVDYQCRGLEVLVRASLHYFNSEAEIDQMVKLLKVI